MCENIRFWHLLPTAPCCVVVKLGKEGQLFPMQKALVGEILAIDLKDVSVPQYLSAISLLTSLDAAKVVIKEGCFV